MLKSSSSRGPQDVERALDRYLASYDVRTAHSIEVQAPVTAVYQAARELDLGRSVPVTALFAIRGLPHLLTGKARPTRALTLATFLQAGFTVLEERAPEELVLGAIGKFWRPDSGLLRIDPGDFVSFDEPGFAKGALAFAVEERGSGSLLETETRVACTDAAALRKFSVYWRLIGPFSGFIRHHMLEQVKRAAEER